MTKRTVPNITCVRRTVTDTHMSESLYPAHMCRIHYAQYNMFQKELCPVTLPAASFPRHEVHILQCAQFPPQVDLPCFLSLIIVWIIPATIRISTSVTRIVPIFAINQLIMLILLVILNTDSSRRTVVHYPAILAVLSLSASLYFLKNSR